MSFYNVEWEGREPDAFLDACRAAMERVSEMAGKAGGDLLWIRDFPYGPRMEDFSFFFGGQAYFALVADGGKRIAADAVGRLLHIARGYDGYACIASKDVEGWGLLDVATRLSLDPLLLASDEPCEVTDWELLDFAIQVARDILRKDGHVVTSWLCEPGMQPSIWFKEGDEFCWMMVEAFRGHDFDEHVPENLKAYAANIFARGYRGNSRGYYRAIGFLPPDGKEKLLRGQGASVRLGGMQEMRAEDFADRPSAFLNPA